MTVSIASASASSFYGTEPPGNAIDSDTGTHWTTATSSAFPHSLILLLTAAAAVTGYSIRRRDDIPDRNINTFEFQGILYATLTPSASSEYDAGVSGFANAFDSDSATAWASSTATVPQWLTAQVSSVALTSYTIGCNDVACAPKDWVYQGSNDNSSWTDLDTRTGVAFSIGVSQTFTFSNATAYTYYRLYITATGTASNFVRVATLDNWVNLDTRTSITWGSAGETKTFPIVNTIAYERYRLYITANNGDAYTSITEVTLDDAAIPVIRTRRTAGVVRAAQQASRW